MKLGEDWNDNRRSPPTTKRDRNNILRKPHNNYNILQCGSSDTENWKNKKTSFFARWSFNWTKHWNMEPNSWTWPSKLIRKIISWYAGHSTRMVQRVPAPNSKVQNTINEFRQIVSLFCRFVSKMSVFCNCSSFCPIIGISQMFDENILNN